MKRNGSNSNMERIQDMPYDYSFIESINNNLPTMPNNNLIDLSQHSPQAYDLTTEGNTQSDPSCNRAIRTKGAKKFIIDNNGSSHQSALSSQPGAINYAFRTESDQQPLPLLPAIDASSVECSDIRQILDRFGIVEDISSVENQMNVENNAKSEEVDQTYLSLDHSTLSRLEKHSEINKIIIQTLLSNLRIVRIPYYPTVEKSRGVFIIDGKAFKILARSIMDIFARFSQNSMKKPSCNIDTQTEIDSIEPTIVGKIYTQNLSESVSLPKAKINLRSNKVHQNKESTKEQTPWCYQNVNASNQNTNVYNIQQEQFYDNQQLYPQLPSDQSYVMQTPGSNRNKMQPQMMQFGMPQTNAMQSTEPGNSGVHTIQRMNQYGRPHTQTANTMMQRPDCFMSGMQIPQTGMPQHDSAVTVQRPDCFMSGMQIPQTGMSQHDSAVVVQRPDCFMSGMQMQQTGMLQHDDSAVIAQRADVIRNRMKPILQARSSHPPNANVVAVSQTYYNHRKSGDVLRQEIPREVPSEMPQNQPQLQTVLRASNPSSGRDRRTHGSYAAVNPPYPHYPQWHVPANQYQYGNN